MAATISVTEDDLLVELWTYLTDLFGCPVIRGYENNAPLPKDCIVMHMLFERGLDYTANYWDAETSDVTAQNSVEATFQFDFYGEEANSRARVVANLWRSPYSTEKLTKCQPLYCGEPRKNILVNESNQYENRMMLEVKLQYNPETTYQADSTDSASIELNNI